MKVTATKAGELTQRAFWLLPALMVAAGVIAGLLVPLLDADLGSDAALARAVAALGASSATAEALAEAERWAAAAVAALEPLPPGAVKDALVAFAWGVTARDR